MDHFVSSYLKSLSQRAHLAYVLERFVYSRNSLFKYKKTFTNIVQIQKTFTNMEHFTEIGFSYDITNTFLGS